MWWEAEFHRTAGEIERIAPERDAAKAQTSFERALEIARAQQARSFELRAATSLARFRRDQGRHAEALSLLAPVYGWFTEGFVTLPCRERESVGTSGIVRQMRLQSATLSSRQCEAHGAFGRR